MGIPDIKEPPEPRVWITSNSASVSISSGQSVPVNFVLHKTAVRVQVSLSVGTLPQGITAAFSESNFAGGTGTEKFTLTLTAALNVTPVLATIQVTASALNVDDAHASITMNVKAVGEVQPSYILLTILYAPPGSASAKNLSKVVYGSGSTTGTTISTSSSFKDGVTVSPTLNLPYVDLGGEFTASQTGTDSSSVEIDKSVTWDTTVPGPPEDGIDHGYDQFWLWLKPPLNVTIDYQYNVSWEIAAAGQQIIIVYVQASELQDPSTMRRGVAGALADAGVTTADYPLILACDPFSSGNTAIDPNRFVLTTQTAPPYEPPTDPNGTPDTVTYTQTSSTIVTNTQETDIQYAVTASVSDPIKGLLDGLLKVSGSLEWTAKSTSTLKTGSSQSASVSITGPADHNYPGPNNVAIYWDTIFQSFMFAFVNVVPAVAGTLVDNAGNPIRYKMLTLTTRGLRLRAFTNGKGEYRFYGAQQGSGTLSDGDHEFQVTVDPNEPKRTLQVTD